MDDRALLIKRDQTRAIHRDGESNLPTRTTNPTDNHTGFVVKQDVTAGGGVIQTAVHTGRTDAQRICGSARTVGTVATREGTREAGAGIGTEAGFIHLQAICRRNTGTDARAIIAEADGLAQIERG